MCASPSDADRDAASMPSWRLSDMQLPVERRIAWPSRSNTSGLERFIHASARVHARATKSSHVPWVTSRPVRL